MEAVTADGVGIAREPELDVEPEEGTELLQSHDKSRTDELLFMHEQRKRLPEIGSYCW